MSFLLPSVASPPSLPSSASSSSTHPSSTSTSTSKSTTTSSSSSSNHGHRGQCSALQHQWQSSHPIYRAIQNGHTIQSFLNSSGIARQYHDMLGDLSELVPPSVSLLSLRTTEPALIDYVQLPFHIWAPDFFYPHLVPVKPCTTPKCSGHATRQRWNPNGARVVHGVHSAVYLLCWQYKCLSCSTTFMGWDDNVLQKLPPAVRARFRFVLTHKSGVTRELHQRIIDARVHGGSLKQLEKELNRNRHTRMHETITAYYRHCEHYKLSRQIDKLGGGAGRSSLLSHFSSHSQGAPHTFAILRPELHPQRLSAADESDTGQYYFDWPAPSVNYMGSCSPRSTTSATRAARRGTR